MCQSWGLKCVFVFVLCTENIVKYRLLAEEMTLYFRTKQRKEQLPMCVFVYISVCVCVCVCGRAVTATNRVRRWRIVERPPDMGASCEISGATALVNKQSRTNSGSSIRTWGWPPGCADGCHQIPTSPKTELCHGDSRPP